MSHSYLDDLFDRIEEDLEEIEDWPIDIAPDIWESGVSVDEHPVCPYGDGDANGLCVKEIYGCYNIACEYADIEG